MISKNTIKRIFVGTLPALIGLGLCFNGLKNVEGELANNPNTIDFVFADSKEKEVKVAEEEIIAEEVKEPEIVEENIDALEIVITAKSGLNIREDANVGANKVGAYPFASRLTVSVKKGDWYKTEKGFISADLTLPLEEAIETGVISELDLEIYDRLNTDMRETLNVGVTGKSNLSIYDIRAYTNKYPGLKGVEEAVIRAEYEHGVNAFMSLAVASLESQYGNSSISRDKNNLYGMNAQDHNPYNLAFSYNSKYSSVMDFAERINANYINRGLTTLETIQEKYCPTDSSWDNKVNKIMYRIHDVAMSER